jgi:hypothetical protein
LRDGLSSVIDKCFAGLFRLAALVSTLFNFGLAAGFLSSNAACSAAHSITLSADK